ncbi:cinnamyl-alcohol dehydrogenase [Cryptosporidium bovis]|uniref:cinnamyl-alcohol dehydrogenase n=1 Tax=Cryptosporidium bovis TaxID=310047 RepID=UPI00351A1605|nr:cinnamyl-alcohol dehydrogenase [Cryptosporidium bovis]
MNTISHKQSDKDENLYSSVNLGRYKSEESILSSKDNHHLSGRHTNYYDCHNVDRNNGTQIYKYLVNNSDLGTQEYQTNEIYSCMEPILFDKNKNHITVLVTGATGFIAAHIVERLLLRGYKVRATTRTKSSPNCVQLLNFPYASENLMLIEADILDCDSWESIVKGCNIVIHCASPYKMDCNDPYEIINPAVLGTKNVISACCMCEDVQTVVVTSSIAAIVGSYIDGKVYSEIDWNNDCDPKLQPYLFSKVEAEKIANRVIDERKPSLNLLVVNPGMVIGPSYRDDINQSVQWIYDMITGKIPLTIDLQSGWVDVRDVAEIHIRLFESENVSGRYICIEGMYTLNEISKIIRTQSPHLNSPTRNLPSFIAKLILPMFTSKNVREFLKSSLGKRILISKGRVHSQFPSYKFLPISESLRDTCTDLINRFGVKK